MKVLVIENTSSVDEKIVSYINQNLTDLDITYVTNLIQIEKGNTEKLNELMLAMSNCDTILFCSSFTVNTKSVVELLNKYKNIKNIDVMYLYDEFEGLCNVLNDDVDLFKKLIIERNVHQILHATYVSKTNKYFNSTSYLFQKIPLYYNKKDKVIYFKKRPKAFLLNEIFIPKEKEKVKEVVKEIKPTLDSDLVREIKSFLDYQYELRKDDGNIELIRESERWKEEFSKLFSK